MNTLVDAAEQVITSAPEAAKPSSALKLKAARKSAPALSGPVKKPVRVSQIKTPTEEEEKDEESEEEEESVHLYMKIVSEGEQGSEMESSTSVYFNTDESKAEDWVMECKLEQLKEHNFLKDFAAVEDSTIQQLRFQKTRSQVKAIGAVALDDGNRTAVDILGARLARALWRLKKCVKNGLQFSKMTVKQLQRRTVSALWSVAKDVVSNDENEPLFWRVQSRVYMAAITKDEIGCEIKPLGGGYEMRADCEWHLGDLQSDEEAFSDDPDGYDHTDDEEDEEKKE